MALTAADVRNHVSFWIEHKISANQQFTGAAPTNDAVFDEDLLGVRHAAGSAGGLFDTWPTGTEPFPMRVEGIEIDFGSQTSWTLSIISDDSVDITWQTGTSEGFLVLTSDEEVKLFPGQKVKLVTTGATQAMSCKVKYTKDRGQ